MGDWHPTSFRTMPRSLATLTVAFGLVAIPVKLFSSTRRASKLRFRWMTKTGEPVRQAFVADEPVDFAVEEDVTSPEPSTPASTLFSVPLQGAVHESDSEPVDAAVEEEPEPQARAATRAWRGPVADGLAAGPQALGRSSLAKALELAPGKFVLFTPAELQALETPRRDSIDLVAFVPPHAVDPIYVDKSFFLAPAARAERPYRLLIRALQETGRCALARWAWRGREHPALLRPWDGVLVLHQLHAGDTVRTPAEFDVQSTDVSDAELDLAVRLVQGSAQSDFDPMDYVDPARQRILDAAHRKLAGGKAIERKRAESAPPMGGNVVDLMAALKASLKSSSAPARRPPRGASPIDVPRTARRRG